MNAPDRAEVISAGDVLVVDDSLDNLRLLIGILTGAGYQARPAGNGELALRSARAKRPALILLDIRMPDVDGFEVCRRLKADEPTRDIPVIFLTGLTDTADKTKGFSLGAMDYITKPFQAEEVLARVRVHLALAAANDQLGSKNLLLQRANAQLTGEIAERKRAEDALRENKDRLEELYLAVGEGIVSVDAEQRIVLFNSAAARIFGRSAASVIGQPLTILIPARFHAPHDKHFSDFDVSGQSSRKMGAHGLIFGRRANGEEFPIEAAVSQSGISPKKLFTVILRDITERRRAEQLREQLTQQLELLSARLATAQEQERRKIAYELHEELGQELAAMKLYLQLIGPGSGSTDAVTHREAALAAAVDAMERVRKLVLDLVPPELEMFGLDAAVRTYCEDLAGAGGWDLHVDAPKPAERSPRGVERACFRVLQDHLTTVLHHAQATKVAVRLHQDAVELELVIRDNGTEFDPDPDRDDKGAGGSLALFAMQIRAKQVGGSVVITSVPAGGTEVRAIFPLPASSVDPV